MSIIKKTAETAEEESPLVFQLNIMRDENGNHERVAYLLTQEPGYTEAVIEDIAFNPEDMTCDVVLRLPEIPYTDNKNLVQEIQENLEETMAWTEVPIAKEVQDEEKINERQVEVVDTQDVSPPSRKAKRNSEKDPIGFEITTMQSAVDRFTPKPHSIAAANGDGPQMMAEFVPTNVKDQGTIDCYFPAKLPVFTDAQAARAPYIVFSNNRAAEFVFDKLVELGELRNKYHNDPELKKNMEKYDIYPLTLLDSQEYVRKCILVSDGYAFCRNLHKLHEKFDFLFPEEEKGK
jgi:hypothetical protein